MSARPSLTSCSMRWARQPPSLRESRCSTSTGCARMPCSPRGLPHSWRSAVFVSCKKPRTYCSSPRRNTSQSRRYGGTILGCAGVAEVHDLHVWRISEGFDTLSAHVVLRRNFHGADVCRDVAEQLRITHGLTHVTIQPEAPKPDEIVSCGAPWMANLSGRARRPPNTPNRRSERLSKVLSDVLRHLASNGTPPKSMVACSRARALRRLRMALVSTRVDCARRVTPPMKSINPATGELIKQYNQHTLEAARRAAGRAQAAAEHWRSTPLEERARLLLRLEASLLGGQERAG